VAVPVAEFKEGIYTFVVRMYDTKGAEVFCFRADEGVLSKRFASSAVRDDQKSPKDTRPYGFRSQPGTFQIPYALLSIDILGGFD